MFFNLFLYQFTRSTIQTTAKTQNIFILVRNSNMDGDMYNGFLFNRLYQTRESNERQSGPSGLVIYPGYRQFHPINVSTSHDESPARSESPSDSSGSGSEHVNKRLEATEVKILISVYKDHHENLNNSKSSIKRKKICSGEDLWHFYWTLQSGWHWKLEKLSSNKEVEGTIRKIQSDCWQQQQEAISQKEILFRFRKDVQSEKGWG